MHRERWRAMAVGGGEFLKGMGLCVRDIIPVEVWRVA